MRHSWVKGVVVLSLVLLAGQWARAADVAQSTDTAQAAAAQAAPGAVGGKAALTARKDRESYAVGVQMATRYKQLGMDVDADLMARAMKDVLSGGPLLMTDKDVADTLIEFQAELMAKTNAERTTLAAENKQKGEEFLAANKAKDGVTTLPDGLQFKVLTAGTGKLPTEDDTVEVNYRGTLVDGTEFENTYKAGQPMTFKLSDQRVIEGLREVLKLMPVGSKWQVFVPSRLAFLDRGAGRIIGPNSVLIYELELVAIK